MDMNYDYGRNPEKHDSSVTLKRYHMEISSQELTLFLMCIAQYISEVISFT